MPGAVRVLVTDVGDVRAEARATYHGLLDEAERRRNAGYRADRDRLLHLVSHALVRTALSSFVDAPPNAWRFGADRHGRPTIAGPAHPSPLGFSMSHTDGLVAVAVARTNEVGVDVEHVGPDSFEEIERFLAPEELAGLRGLAGRPRTEALLATWTVKEAYAKARGRGLSLPPRDFTIALHGAVGAALTRAPDEEHPGAWAFVRARPTPRHLLAVAVRRAAGDPDPQVSIWRGVPLGEWVPLPSTGPAPA